MSRSALRRAEELRERATGHSSAEAAAAAFVASIEVSSRPSMVAMLGGCCLSGGESAFNVAPLVRKRIVGSKVFRNACKLTSFSKIVDEIYYTVKHVEPCEVGGSVPSPAFCLLFRLFLLKVTNEQMGQLLSHKDSPYIRALGVLYLRFTCPHNVLLKWLGPLLNDKETFTPGTGSRARRTVTMGEWINDLVANVSYYDTVLPRIPARVISALREKGAMLKEDAKRRIINESFRQLFARGTIVRARWSEDDLWYDARIEEEADDGEGYWVTFLPEEDYGNEENVPLSKMCIPEKRSEYPSASSFDHQQDDERGRGSSGNNPSHRRPYFDQNQRRGRGGGGGGRRRPRDGHYYDDHRRHNHPSGREDDSWDRRSSNNYKRTKYRR